MSFTPSFIQDTWQALTTATNEQFNSLGVGVAAGGIAGRIDADKIVLTGAMQAVGPIGFDHSTQFTDLGDGVLKISNFAGNDFTSMALGGVTIAFPMLKRNGVAIESKLANDSAYTDLRALKFVFGDVNTEINSGAGGTGRLTVKSANVNMQYIDGSNVKVSMPASARLSWSASADPASGTPDIGLARNGVGILEINSDTVGTFRDLTLRNLLSSGGSVLSNSPSAGIGYTTGAGIAPSQSSSKATTVSANGLCGTLTLNGAALAADTTVSFTFTNTSIAANDIVVFVHSSVGTIGAYTFGVTPGAGTATVSVHNCTPGSLSEAIILRWFVFKGVVA